MEGGRKQMGSSSSLTNELFGSKESPSSSGIFASIFSPPSKVLGREALHSESMEKKNDCSREAWNSKTGAPGDASRRYETESQGMVDKDTSSMYQDQRVQPCHLSSSIYYGGQDVYSPRPPNSQGPGINSVFRNLLTSCNALSSKKMEKMILGVLREEIGGKDLSIIKS